MIFHRTSVDRIASISQRALLSYWQRLAAGRSYPAPREFSPGERIYDPKQLVIWHVEHAGPARTFRAKHQGAHVAEVFGQNWAGRTMDEVVPEFGRAFALHSADTCA